MSFLARGLGGLCRRFHNVGRCVEPNLDPQISAGVIDEAKGLIAANAARNFAVVHVMGKQRRVTDGDLLVIEGHWAPQIGDKMSLDKVLLAGSEGFTLIGRPLVQPGLVSVTATVVAKGLSTTRTHFAKRRRKQYMRIDFHRAYQTTLRINKVQIGPHLNET